MFLSDSKVRFSDVAHGAALLLLPFGLFVLWLPLEILDPGCVSWLLNGDLGQHFTGFALFRHDSWHFPLMKTALAGYPNSISMIFTDCNPLFALPCKLFSPWLPERFQFTGIWFLCCTYLNFFIIYALLKAYSLDRWTAVLGAWLLCLYPPLFGLAVHDTLCAHWIITALLYALLVGKRPWLAFPLLCIVATMVHFYFVVFVMCAALAKPFFELGLTRAAVRQAAGLAGVTAAVMLAATVVLGYWGFQPEGWGFGHFSMNINSIFNPQGWSRILPDLPLGTTGQYEGFQYLGLGWLVCILAGLILGRRVLSRRQVWALAGCFVLPLTALALSNNIYFGDQLVFSYPMPSSLLQTFQSSGRFFWGVGYLLGILSVIKLYRARLVWVIALALAVQMIDVPCFSPALLRAHVRDKEFCEPVPGGMVGPGKFTHVNTSLASDLSTPAFYQLLLIFAENRLPVTHIYMARQRGAPAPGLTCAESLDAGGLCCLDAENVLSVGDEPYWREYNGLYLVARSPLNLGQPLAAPPEPE